MRGICRRLQSSSETPCGAVRRRAVSQHRLGAWIIDGSARVEAHLWCSARRMEARRDLEHGEGACVCFAGLLVVDRIEQVCYLWWVMTITIVPDVFFVVFVVLVLVLAIVAFDDDGDDG
jgi:hypothetical protein